MNPNPTIFITYLKSFQGCHNLRNARLPARHLMQLLLPWQTLSNSCSSAQAMFFLTSVWGTHGVCLECQPLPPCNTVLLALFYWSFRAQFPRPFLWEALFGYVSLLSFPAPVGDLLPSAVADTTLKWAVPLTSRSVLEGQNCSYYSVSLSPSTQ